MSWEEGVPFCLFCRKYPGCFNNGEVSGNKLCTKVDKDASLKLAYPFVEEKIAIVRYPLNSGEEGLGRTKKFKTDLLLACTCLCISLIHEADYYVEGRRFEKEKGM